MRNAKRVLACMLATVMALSVSVTTSTKTSEAEETTSKLSELKQVLFDNLPENQDFSGSVTSADITSYTRNTYNAYLHDWAVHCKAKNPKSKADYYDIDEDGHFELFVNFSKTYNVYSLNDNNYEAELLKTFTKVTSIYENSKKKQIVVYQKSGKKKTYTSFKKNGKKIKKTLTYASSGKTYKKNGKKITKKAFNKYVKSVSKLDKVKPTKIDDSIYGAYLTTASTRLEKDTCVNSIWDYENELDKITTVFKKDAAGNYVAYWFTQLLLPTDEGARLEESDPEDLCRALFGPKLTDPAFGDDTYQHRDWKRFLQEVIDDQGRVCPELMAQDATAGSERMIVFDSEDIDGDVTSAETTAGNGTEDQEYKAISYKYHYTDTATEIIVFAEGPYKGRIHSIKSFTSVNPTDPYDGTDFVYNQPQEGQLYDPLTDIICAGTVDEIKNSNTGAPIRSVTIESVNMPGATERSTETISVGGVVRFITATYESKARFYTIGEGGLDVDVTSGSHEEMLNPPVNETLEDKLYQDAAFPNSLFWEPKKVS